MTEESFAITWESAPKSALFCHAIGRSVTAIGSDRSRDKLERILSGADSRERILSHVICLSQSDVLKLESAPESAPFCHWLRQICLFNQKESAPERIRSLNFDSNSTSDRDIRCAKKKIVRRPEKT